MRYLVDLGRLVPVLGVTAHDAFTSALLDVGRESQFDSSACVYVLDKEGKVLGVVPCEFEERKDSV